MYTELQMEYCSFKVQEPWTCKTFYEREAGMYSHWSDEEQCIAHEPLMVCIAYI